VAVTPIAVVAEQPGDPRTHVDHLLGRHERAQTAGEVRGRADVHHLVHRALHTAVGDRDLVLAGAGWRTAWCRSGDDPPPRGAGVVSMVSSRATPARGQPMMERVTSP
jgi:hypothetical protein